jgi:N6-adenosine-specific RNA methylase IME4
MAGHARKAGRVTYACIVADPPWSFGDRLPGPGRGAEKHYDVLDLEAIKTFALPSIADDAWLFLWRVSSQVEEAYQVCRAWGFVPKSEIVWLKRTSGGKRWFGMGRSVRAEHETAIIAKRGRPPILNNGIRSTFEALVPERGHSAKPDEFFSIVESLCSGPRLELFARVDRPGWTCLGDQLEEGFGA